LASSYLAISYLLLFDFERQRNFLPVKPRCSYFQRFSCGDPAKLQ